MRETRDRVLKSFESREEGEESLSFEWHFRLSAKLGVFRGRGRLKKRERHRIRTFPFKFKSVAGASARVNALVQWRARGNLVVEADRKYGRKLAKST